MKPKYKFGDIFKINGARCIVVRVTGRKYFKYQVIHEKPEYSENDWGVNGIVFSEFAERELNKLVKPSN